MKLAVFKVDCTPPPGTPVLYGSPSFDRAESIRDPLYLRGFIFEENGERFLVASMDYCGLMNSAHDQMVDALGAAVGADQEKVIVHCVHQHDAPLVNFEIEPLLRCSTFSRKWWDSVVEQCALSTKSALRDFQEVTHVGRNECRVHGYASNRRVVGPDGKVLGSRTSRCSDPALKNSPVGVIDPMLRTVCFRNEERLIASMSFYASHPQVANGAKMFSADAPGEALRRVESVFPSALHAYFTGASGNVAAGKYTSRTDLEGNISKFGGILAEAIMNNLGNPFWEKQASLEYQARSFPFPFPEIDRARWIADISDKSLARITRELKAVLLSCYDYRQNSEYPVRRIKAGSASMFFLVGEPFVEYQLFLQGIVPDRFIAVAANCSHDFNYLPLAEFLDAGGYEMKLSLCSARFETLFKNAMAEICNMETGETG